MLIELREHCANIQMSVCLGFWSLKPRLDSQSSLQKVESSSHFTNSSIIASHVIKSHCLTKLVVLAELLRFFQEIEGTVDILFFKIIDS